MSEGPYTLKCSCGNVGESTHYREDWKCFSCRDHSEDIYISEIEIEHQEKKIKIVTGGFTTTSPQYIIRELEKTIRLVKEKFSV
jgi:hypothetical protein